MLVLGRLQLSAAHAYIQILAVQVEGEHLALAQVAAAQLALDIGANVAAVGEVLDHVDAQAAVGAARRRVLAECQQLHLDGGLLDPRLGHDGKVSQLLGHDVNGARLQLHKHGRIDGLLAHGDGASPAHIEIVVLAIRVIDVHVPLLRIEQAVRYLQYHGLHEAVAAWRTVHHAAAHDGAVGGTGDATALVTQQHQRDVLLHVLANRQLRHKQQQLAAVQTQLASVAAQELVAAALRGVQYGELGIHIKGGIS